MLHCVLGKIGYLYR